MKVLIDTHIAMWVVTDDPQLPTKAKEIVEDKKNEIYYSTASIWETTIKHMIRPNDVLVSGHRLEEGCEGLGFICLPILNKHVLEVETLKREEGAPRHNDPFDRLLLAQAKSEGMMFVTHDTMLPYYNEPFLAYTR